MHDSLKKYIEFGKTLGLKSIMAISSDDIQFDIRALLKCKWGCDDFNNNLKCSSRNLSFEERMEIVKKYSKILLLHSEDPHILYKICLEIEKSAFHDGYYFAFTLRACYYCKVCSVMKNKDCPHPEKIRPCDQSFGIDVYKTVNQLGLPCKVLTEKDEVQNRYGFVCIE